MSVDDVNNSSSSGAVSDMAAASELLDFLDASDNEAECKPATPNHQSGNVSEDESANEDSPSLTMSITNVVVMASMQCHLRLKEIARTSVNVEYKALQNHVIMRLRSPYTVATIWSSGKIWCTGANSLAKAKIGARRIARRIAKCGFPCKFGKYRVVNIMATCHLPFRVRLEELVKDNPKLMSYEPELSPGLTFKADPNSSTLLKLFSTGRVVIMGPTLEAISALVETLIPLAAPHQTDEPISDSDSEPERGLTKNLKAPSDMLATTHRMLMLPGELPLEALGYVEEDYEEGSDDSDIDLATTDDSTDSGASIDSGGMSTRPKRRRKRFKRSSLTGKSQPLNPGFNGSGDGGAAYANPNEMPHDSSVSTSITNSSVTSEDPSWSRQTVSSGSTKRACVISYTGTEDSNDLSTSVIPPNTTHSISVGPYPNQPISSNVTAHAHTISNASTSQSQNPPFLVPPKMTPPNSNNGNNQFQFAPQVISAQPQVFRLASNSLITLAPQTSNTIPTVYPIRLSAPGLQQPAPVIPLTETNAVCAAPSARGQYVDVTPSPTYQLIQPGTQHVFVSGSTVYHPTQVSVTTPGFFPRPPGVFLGQVPQTFVPLRVPSVPVSPNFVPVNPILQTFTGPSQSRLS